MLILQSLSERQEVMGAHLGSVLEACSTMWTLVLAGSILKFSLQHKYQDSAVPTSPSIPVTGTPKAKQLARQNHSPMHQQACALMSPEPAAPRSQALSTREPVTWPTERCPGSSLRPAHAAEGEPQPRRPCTPDSPTSASNPKVPQPEALTPGFMHD